MRVVGLNRFPVKGFSADPMTRVRLAPGGTFPLDRAYAIENGPSGFDPEKPVHISKMKFLVLAAQPRVAELQSRFEEADHRLILTKGTTTVAEGSLATPEGRAAIETFIADYFGADLRGSPRVLHLDGHSFSDIGQKAVHIINLASLRELEGHAARPLDPLRFRANIIVEDLPAWAEFDMIDREITLGTTRLKLFHRTQRCAATSVNPETATRDIEVPRTLFGAYGHPNFGVYAHVVGEGEIAVGDVGG
jgi:uncharacterized protein YcbX